MKNKLLLLILFSLYILPTTGQVRTKKDIQNAPQDISEYFLLLPSEKYWTIEEDQSDKFKGRQLYLKNTPKRKVTIDKKNAYISIVDGSEELEFRFTMSYFIKSDKSKVIAVNYYQQGGDCDSYLLKFYTYTTNKWVDVTNGTLPSLSLKNLKVIEKNFIPVDFHYTLPQYGTSISARIDPICEQAYEANGIDYMSYFEKFKKLTYKTIQLKWVREKGIFELGEVK